MMQRPMSDLAKQIRGVSYKPADLHDKLDSSSVVLLRANNIDDGELNFDDVVFVDRRKVSESQYLQRGDILICASSGSLNLVGKAAQVNVDGDYTFGAFCKVVRPTNVSADYLGAFFQSPNYRHTISTLAQGVNINNIKNEHIDLLMVRCPDESVQKEVVEVIRKTANIIRERKQQLVALDTLIKARFVEMFGDVIANDRAWQQHTFSDITSSRLGKMLNVKKQAGENNYPYLANFNVQWFRFELNSLNTMDFDDKERKEFELQEGDLLVCEGGEIGRCAIWHDEIQPCFFQKALHRVRCDTRTILPEYLAWWFKYNCDHSGFAAIKGAKATISHLPGAKLKVLRVAVPPLALQSQFAAFVAQVDKSRVVVQKALDEAQVLFDSLMQKYFG